MPIRVPRKKPGSSLPEPPGQAGVVLTIGHSTRPLEEFLAMLTAHGVEELIDVRTAPGSRRFPHFNSSELAGSLKKIGIAYRHMPGLGGFRKPRPDSPNAAWKNSSFRGYADYMQTAEFEQHLGELIRAAANRRVVIMCSEAVPWRCHRSLIADALTARGVGVEHIMSEKKRDPHRLTSFARVFHGRITYPSQEPSLYEADSPAAPS